MKDNYAYSEPWHIQNSLFNPFQGFLCIFKDIDVYSVTLTDTERGGLKVSWFWKERPWLCPSLGTIFQCFFQNVVLRVLGEKFPKYFLAEPLFFVLLKKCLSNCPSSTYPPPHPLPPPPTVLFLQNYSPKYSSVLITAG